MPGQSAASPPADLAVRKWPLALSEACGKLVKSMESTNLQPVIDEIVRRLVEFYKPEKIYLFGSTARGEAGPDSDLDFLVVVPDDCPKEIKHSSEIHLRLWGIEQPTDVIVWSHTGFEGRLPLRASLPATVVREGRLLYAAETVPA
jgi:predicted nucleotidyltransferase